MNVNLDLAFNAQFALSLLISIAVAWWYVLPWLRSRGSLGEAMTPLLLISALRHFGLTFAIPSLTNNLDPSLVVPAVGDFASAVIALCAAVAFRRSAAAGKLLAWLYVVVGLPDLIYGLYLGGIHQLPQHIGAVWLNIIFLAPLVLTCLVLIIMMLVRGPAPKPAHA